MSQDQDPKAKPALSPKQDNSATSAFATLDFGDISKDLDDLFANTNDPLFGGTPKPGTSLLDDLFFSSTKKQEPLQPAITPSTPSIAPSDATDVSTTSPAKDPNAEDASHASQTTDTSAFVASPQDHAVRVETSDVSQTTDASAFVASSHNDSTRPVAETSSLFAEDSSKTTTAMAFVDFAPTLPKQPPPPLSRPATPPPPPPLSAPPSSPSSLSSMFPPPSSSASTLPSRSATPPPPPAAAFSSATPPPPPAAAFSSATPPPPPAAAFSSPPSTSEEAEPSVDSPKKQRSMAQTIAFGPDDLAALRSISVASEANPPSNLPVEEHDHADTTAQAVMAPQTAGTPAFGTPALQTPPEPPPPAQTTGTPAFGTPTLQAETQTEPPPPAQTTGTPAFGTPALQTPPESPSLSPQMTGTPAFGTPTMPPSPSVASPSPLEPPATELKKPERAMAQTLMFGFDMAQLEGLQKAQDALKADNETANDTTTAISLTPLPDPLKGVPSDNTDFDATSFGSPSPFAKVAPSASISVPVSSSPMLPPPAPSSPMLPPPAPSSPKVEMNKTVAFGLQISDFMGSGFPESTLEDIPMQAVQEAVREREMQKANEQAAAESSAAPTPAMPPPASPMPAAPPPASRQTVALGAEEMAEAFKARATRMNERETQSRAPSPTPPTPPTLHAPEKKPAASQTLMFGAEDVQAALQQRNAAPPTSPQSEERPVFAVTVDLNAQAARSIQQGAPADSFFDALLPAQAIEQAVQERIAAQQAEQSAASSLVSTYPHPQAPHPQAPHPGVAGPKGGAMSNPNVATTKPKPPPTVPMRQPNPAPPSNAPSKIPLILGAAAAVLLLLYVLGFVWPGFFK